MAVPAAVIVFALFLNALWGGNVPAVKFGLLAFPPLWSAFFRFSLGALCLALWARCNGIPLRPERQEWRGLLVLGGLFTLQISLMNLGIHWSTGAMASVLIATNPIFAGLFAHFFLAGDRLTPLRGLGLALAFVGVAVMFLRGGWDVWAQSTALGNLACVASAALLGGRLVFTASLLQRMESTRVVLWQMLIGLPLFALSGALWEEINWQALDWQPVIGIFYQGVVVAGVAFMGMAYLLRRYPASVVLSFNFVSPVVGVLLSWVLLGEPLTWHVLVSVAAVGTGLVLVARK